MQSRQLTAFAKDFANLKGKRPNLSSAVLDEILNNKIKELHLDFPAYIFPVMNGYKIHFNMEPTLDSGVFLTEDEAQIVLNSYNEANQNTPKWKAWNTLKKDSLKSEIQHDLYEEYTQKVLTIQNKQSDFLVSEAKKSIKRFKSKR